MRHRAALGLLGLLAGCGFHPLYLPSRGGAGGVNAELATIYVPVIVNREGQIMRQQLQRAFDGSQTGVAKVYDILAQPLIASEGIGILRDNSTTRYRLNGSVTWYLRKLDVAHTVVASGVARAVDGFNENNQQYFALDLTNEAVTRRVVEALADQVVQQVAVFLDKQAAGRAPAPGVVETPLPGPIVPPGLLGPGSGEGSGTYQGGGTGGPQAPAGTPGSISPLGF